MWKYIYGYYTIRWQLFLQIFSNLIFLIWCFFFTFLYFIQ
jgi:hypothetical protein